MADLKRVLLLGDSIRITYQPSVQEMLKGRAEVTGPADNCQFCLYTLSALWLWIEQCGKPDIIHWNNGIHDAGFNPKRCPAQIPLEDYVGNLRFTLESLQKTTNAVIIWATTTPIHPDKPFLFPERWAFRNEDIDRYNAAALEVMRSEKIPVNDLHGVVWSDYGLYLGEDGLHLSEAGIKKCAEAVTEKVAEYL